jgi:hypothetical protein
MTSEPIIVGGASRPISGSHAHGEGRAAARRIERAAKKEIERQMREKHRAKPATKE